VLHDLISAAESDTSLQMFANPERLDAEGFTDMGH
jgi:hypothetical protein